MQKLRTEIDATFSAFSEITAQATAKIPLIRAVCLEALRIYPSLPLGLPRVVPEGGETVDGHYIPEGTIVSVNPYAASLTPKNFENPWHFKPDRWLKKKGRDILEASQPFRQV
jgi:cytochrome P450